MVSLVAWQTRELSYSSKVPISVSWENLSLLIIFNLIQIKFIEIRLNQGQIFFFPHGKYTVIKTLLEPACKNQLLNIQEF